MSGRLPSKSAGQVCRHVQHAAHVFFATIVQTCFSVRQTTLHTLTSLVLDSLLCSKEWVTLWKSLFQMKIWKYTLVCVEMFTWQRSWSFSFNITFFISWRKMSCVNVSNSTFRWHDLACRFISFLIFLFFHLKTQNQFCGNWIRVLTFPHYSCPKLKMVFWETLIAQLFLSSVGLFIKNIQSLPSLFIWTARKPNDRPL